MILITFYIIVVGDELLEKYFYCDIFPPTRKEMIITSSITFESFKTYIFRKCVDRVEAKRLSQDPVQPQIALCRDDKSLVSFFFNCKTGTNNKYLVTKRLLNYKSKDSDEATGAVPVFCFANEHEVLWGNTIEFRENLFPIFCLLIKDILLSDYENKETVERTLCDNIIYSKYSTFRKIKDTYDISLLENFGIYDETVNEQAMSNYLEIALMHLYHKSLFEESFERIFLSFTKRYNDYTHIEDRLCKDFLPDLLSLLEEYKPSSSSLGLRVKTLIETDIIKALDQMDAYKNNTNFIDTTDYKLNKKIIRASSQYIVELEDIARRSYENGTYIYGW